MHLLLLERTRELIAGCPCESGCPSCVGPEGNTGPHAKAVASRILDDLLLAAAGGRTRWRSEDGRLTWISNRRLRAIVSRRIASRSAS